MRATYEAYILEANQTLRDASISLSSRAGVKNMIKRMRLLHFQLQVTIGSYGYTGMELCLVHGVLLLLVAVVVHWILLQAVM
ncbi:hypothetical protein CVIRNUC_000173 [Coccomyxa viridis]|uniref:Uncharacterized protein n=1 Tax=Coccomyxa viridis TaxID=1274662 RepID=A0AAV1HS14_9CHLO|nr:hypothetical protein CVIRNUC_000173 [Coccomyxa viridis]